MKKQLEETSRVAVEVENEGFVAAGKTIPFPAPDRSTLIVLPPHLAELAKTGLVKTMTIYGNSLQDIGLYDGDEVICKKAFSKKEVGRNTVCIVYIPATGEVVAKKIRFLAGEMVLQSCNKDVPDMKVKTDDVDVRGIIIGLHRTPDELGRFDRNYESEFPF